MVGESGLGGLQRAAELEYGLRRVLGDERQREDSLAGLESSHGYLQSRVARERNASIDLLSASQTIQSGNVALAQSDLEKLVARYAGTNAAAQAAFELATIYYGQGQYDRGIALLEKLAESSDDGLVKAMAENGIAAGYEGAGKFADAAIHYRRAADLTRLADERDVYLANAARAYQAAGNKAEAIALWRRLVDSGGTQAPEARVRLGELTAEPAKQG